MHTGQYQSTLNLTDSLVVMSTNTSVPDSRLAHKSPWKAGPKDDICLWWHMSIHERTCDHTRKGAAVWPNNYLPPSVCALKIMAAKGSLSVLCWKFGQNKTCKDKWIVPTKTPKINRSVSPESAHSWANVARLMTGFVTSSPFPLFSELQTN